MNLFNSLLYALERCSEIEVLTASFNPPAQDADLESAERILGATLHPEIREFFKAHNGLCIRWIHRSNPVFDPQLHVRDDSKIPFPYDLHHRPDPQDPDGCILILPLQDIFFREWTAYPVDSQYEAAAVWEAWSEDLPDGFTHASATLSAALPEQVRWIDFYHRYEGVAMVLEEGVADPRVFLLEDDRYNFDAAKSTTCSAYLRSLAFHAGSTRARSADNFESSIPVEFDVQDRLQAVLQQSWGQ